MAQRSIENVVEGLGIIDVDDKLYNGEEKVLENEEGFQMKGQKIKS